MNPGMPVSERLVAKARTVIERTHGWPAQFTVTVHAFLPKGPGGELIHETFRYPDPVQSEEEATRLAENLVQRLQKGEL